MLSTLYALCILVLAPIVDARHIDNDAKVEQGAAARDQDLPDPKRFMDVVNDMRDRWKAHKQAQMQELEPWKMKTFEEKKMRHRGEREHSLRKHRETQNQEAAGSAPAQAEDRAVRTMTEKESVEARKRAKFGEPRTYQIKDLAGTSFPFKFRHKTHMRVLMNTIYQKLMLAPEEVGGVNIMFNGTEIQPMDTAESLGMRDGSVIMLQGPTMEKRMQTERAQTIKARERAHLAAKADVEKTRARLVKARKQVAKEQREQAIKNAAVLRKHFRDQDMIHLRFDDGRNGTVRLGFRREAPLGNLFKLASDRLGHSFESVANFKLNSTKHRIWLNETVRSLDLQEDDLILMTVNWKKKYSMPEPIAGPVV